MVGAPTRTQLDQFGKQMVRTALEPRGPVATDANVPVDNRTIDLCYMPDRTRGSVPDHLGLLGRIAGGPSTLEFFHNTPRRRVRRLPDQARRVPPLRLAAQTPPPAPTQWSSHRGVGLALQQK
jgi:hypothetical protein